MKGNRMMNKFSNGQYIVIEGEQLADIIQDEHFWKRGSEEKYKKFVEESQPFFEKFQKGEDCIGERIGKANALYVYVDVANCITVKKIDDLYYISSNGRHRAAVAKKYGLKLLVCVMGTQSVEKEAEIKKSFLQRVYEKILKKER